jgi:hypothetical protein
LYYQFLGVANVKAFSFLFFAGIALIFPRFLPFSRPFWQTNESELVDGFYAVCAFVFRPTSVVTGVRDEPFADLVFQQPEVRPIFKKMMN